MNQQEGTGKRSYADRAPRKRWVRSKGLSVFSPLLRVCKECGVPLAISQDHAWEEHGRILSRDTSQRLVIVERKIINGILEKITAKLGREYEKTFIHAKAFDASQYVRSVMVGWRKVAAGYPLVRRPFYELLCDRARILGMADANVAHYQRGKEVIITCTQCYNKTFFAGDILGAVYAGEKREATIDIDDSDGEIIYTVTVLDNERFEAIEKYSFSWEVPLPGYISYKRCKKCGVPFSVSFFSWDISRGLMVDTHNGEPVALIDVAGINAAYAEIKARSGNWVDDFLAVEIKDMVDGILPGLEWKRRRPEEKIRDLFFLAYRGMGNPVFTEPTDDGIRARIENPFNYPIVAGIAASFLARDKPAAFDWERVMPGRLELNLHFL
ncbi:MAG: hypothetical protein C4536_10170 [Actinobacteria bacterium]|nr:MAG: hypothetical protein C4536_10170 [Actinomycetota bacterium]